MFLGKFAHPAQRSGARHDFQGVMDWVTNSPHVAHLEKSDIHSRIAIHCIDILCGLPEGNILQLPNPSILNSDILNLAHQTQSKFSSDIQYSVLYGLLHIVEVENPSIELFGKLETFFAGSVVKWLEVLSLLGAVRNALVKLDKVTMWYKVCDLPFECLIL
jgi:hypothetical protein